MSQPIPSFHQNRLRPALASSFGSICHSMGQQVRHSPLTTCNKYATPNLPLATSTPLPTYHLQQVRHSQLTTCNKYATPHLPLATRTPLPTYHLQHVRHSPLLLDAAFKSHMQPDSPFCPTPLAPLHPTTVHRTTPTLHRTAPLPSRYPSSPTGRYGPKGTLLQLLSPGNPHHEAQLQW